MDLGMENISIFFNNVKMNFQKLDKKTLTKISYVKYKPDTTYATNATFKPDH